MGVKFKMISVRTGPTSFGYRREGGELVADPKEAPVRQLIFELFAKHQRKKTVAEILNADGHTTRAGGIFTAQTITRLLIDETVMGVEGETEPLVSKELWQRCNSILETQKSAGGAKRSVAHLFAGVAYCVCGQKMYVPTNSPKYVCSDCRNKIPKEDLELAFLSQLKLYPLSHDRQANNLTLYERWNSLSFADKRVIVESITHRIEIGDKKVTCFLVSL
jgi:site-specific DNA recombinase